MEVLGRLLLVSELSKDERKIEQTGFLIERLKGSYIYTMCLVQTFSFDMSEEDGRIKFMMWSN